MQQALDQGRGHGKPWSRDMLKWLPRHTLSYFTDRETVLQVKYLIQGHKGTEVGLSQRSCEMTNSISTSHTLKQKKHFFVPTQCRCCTEDSLSTQPNCTSPHLPYCQVTKYLGQSANNRKIHSLFLFFLSKCEKFNFKIKYVPTAKKQK